MLDTIGIISSANPDCHVIGSGPEQLIMMLKLMVHSITSTDYLDYVRKTMPTKLDTARDFIRICRGDHI